MASTFDGTAFGHFHLFGSVNKSVTTPNSISENLVATVKNRSPQNDCLEIVFNEMEFLPWDNPDNVVSEEVEIIAGRIKNNLLWLLFLIGGPANVFNMAVFYKQGLKDRVNLCLFALSLADELCLFNAVVHHGEQVYIQFTTKVRFGPVSTFLSNKNMFVLLGFCYVSPVMSAIIAVERCLCVLNPLKFQNLLSTRSMVAIIIAVYVVIMGLFFFVSYRYRVGCVYDPMDNVAVITSVEGGFYRAHKTIIDPLEAFVFGVGLPGVVMVVVMTATIMTIVKLRQTVKWRSEITSSISAREVAVTKILVANSIFFIACLFPISVNRFSWLFVPEINSGKRNHNLFLLSVWVIETLTYTNSAFNFFVYYSMGSRYRETFWSLFGRKSSGLCSAENHSRETLKREVKRSTIL